MKRYISILLLAAFCFLLSGCSSNQPAETEPTEEISESVEVERPEEMPEMCQIGKMEFALPTNCTYTEKRKWRAAKPFTCMWGIIRWLYLPTHFRMIFP